MAQRRAPALSAPVDVVEPEGTERMPVARAFVRLFDGARWDQPAGEDLEVFRARVAVEATRGAQMLPGHTTIGVLGLRPRLTHTQWAALHGLETTKEMP